jgi:hypothetical protein
VSPAPWLGPVLFAVGVVLSLGFAVAGLATLGKQALILKKRVDALQDLPIQAKIAETNEKIARAQRRIDDLPLLFLRAKAAFESMEAARKRLQHVATTAAGIVNLGRLLFAPPKR